MTPAKITSVINRIKGITIPSWAVARGLLLLLLIAVTLISLRALWESPSYHHHDGDFYLLRVFEFHRALKESGSARWLQNFAGGYGSPYFNFYAPGLFYVTSLFRFLAVSVALSIKLSILIFAVLGVLGMFFLGRLLWGEFGGFLSALFFSLTTYRAVDLFVRGDLAEFSAINVAPLALLAIFQLVDRASVRRLFLAAIAIGLVFLCHNITGMLFAGFVVLLAIYFAIERWRIKGLLWVSAALIWALAITGFFWLPALVEKKYTHVEKMVAGKMDYHGHFQPLSAFLNRDWKRPDIKNQVVYPLAFLLGWEQLIIGVVGGLFCLFVTHRTGQRRAIVILLFILVAFPIFMATSCSLCIWESLPILRFCQFPWRFLTMASLFLPLLCGSLALIWRPSGLAGLVLSGLIFSVLLFQLKESHFQLHPRQRTYHDDSMIEDIIERYAVTANIHDEYRPIWVADEAVPKNWARGGSLEIDQGTGRVEIIRTRTGLIKGEIEASSRLRLRLHAYYFPGWRVKIDNRYIKLVFPPPQGLIEFFCPEGSHEFKMVFQDTMIRKVAKAISALAFLAGMVVFILPLISSSKEKEPLC